MNPETPSKKPYRYPVWLLLAALYGLVTSASSLSIGAINFIQSLIFGTLLVASVAVLVIITVRQFKRRDAKSKVGPEERWRRLIGLTPSHCRNCGAKTIEEDQFCGGCGYQRYRNNLPQVIARAIALFALSLFLLASVVAFVEFTLNVMGNANGFPISIAMVVVAASCFYIFLPFVFLGYLISVIDKIRRKE